MASIWLACPDSDYGRIVQLLMLTGCRREEIGALEWSELDWDAKTVTLPGKRTKNGHPHIVPRVGQGAIGHQGHPATGAQTRIREWAGRLWRLVQIQRGH